VSAVNVPQDKTEIAVFSRKNTIRKILMERNGPLESALNRSIFLDATSLSERQPAPLHEPPD